jgi:hypothetical protein
MIGEQKTEAPVIDFVKSDSDKTITVSTADVDANWKDISITFTNATGSNQTTKSGIVSAGDVISLLTQPLRGKVTVTFIHIPSNSLLATYTIDNV